MNSGRSERTIVAVIMACHNRRDTTLRCLSALSAATDCADSSTRFDLFVTDDGSTDGTAHAILSLYPDATIIRGDGTLYWAAAMALAERRAWHEQPDFLLWLNDDTALAPDAVRTLLTQARDHPGSIIVGAVVSPRTGTVTYGGRRREGSHPQRFSLIGACDRVQAADAFNGNVVLIPADVRARVGPIDDLFPHAYADDDYSLRARGLGVNIWQAPGILGTCEANTTPTRLSGSWVRRWQQLQSPTALPMRAQARYLRRHGDWRWPFWLAGGQIRRVFTGRA